MYNFVINELKLSLITYSGLSFEIEMKLVVGGLSFQNYKMHFSGFSLESRLPTSKTAAKGGGVAAIELRRLKKPYFSPGTQ